MKIKDQKDLDLPGFSCHNVLLTKMIQKRSMRHQSFFAGKAYLKINSLVKTPLHEFIAVERSGLWASVQTERQEKDYEKDLCYREDLN